MKKDSNFANDFAKPSNLENLLEKYSNKLVGFINSIICDISASEDIMMDIFVELIVRNPQFTNEQVIKAYLYKCAKNKSLNYIKKNKRICELNEEMLKDTYEIEEQTCDTYTKKVLYEAIKKLNKNYHTIIYLTYFEDMKIEEVVEIMGINLKQAQNLKHRAIKKLNKILKAQNLKCKI